LEEVNEEDKNKMLKVLKKYGDAPRKEVNRKMGETHRYFLYLLIGKSKSAIRNLKNATLPLNIKIVDFVNLDKHGYRYVIVIFDADTEEDARSFASYLSSFKATAKQGYLLPGLYQVKNFE
jgi:hypothetical protein